MPDYGRDVEFGVFPAPEAAKLREVFQMVAAAEGGGLDLVGVQDHPYQRRFVDTFVLISAILERTRRIRVFPDVANIPLRPPAVLAQTAATLDARLDAIRLPSNGCTTSGAQSPTGRRRGSCAVRSASGWRS